MYLAALLTSLPADFAAAVAQVRALGFTHADVVGLAERPAAHLDALADSGLLVGCAAVGRGLALDAEALAERRAAVDEVRRQIADAARLGATACYVVAGHDATRDGLVRFADACAVLAAYAAGRMVRLCVEHMPGRALPTATAALDWLDRVDHANLALLLDVGHCLISDEDPARLAAAAGDRLGYVHLDDNDTVADLHWPLLTGRLTGEMLEALLTVLELGEYDGGLALELNPHHPDPAGALRDGKAIVEALWG